MTAPIDWDNQVKEALRIPISEELVDIFEETGFSAWVGSKVLRSLV